MPHTDIQKLVDSLDTFADVRSVNVLIQGLCARTVANDLGSGEARGLMVVLGWQNEKMLSAEAEIQNILKNKAAHIKAA